jgi:ATP-binding cassette subfamily F protein 3
MDAIEARELVQRYRGRTGSSARCTSTRRASSAPADRVETPKSSRRLRLPAGALAGAGPRDPARSRPHPGARRSATCRVGALDADGSPATEPRRVAEAPFLAAQRGDRIGIVGPNGAGKTTLLRTIAGDLPPLDGMLTFGNAVQPGYLAQLRDSAIPGATVLDALLAAIPITAGEARAYLARFLFRGEDVFKEVRSLSGGERSRLELALLGILPSNLLLLDELMIISTSPRGRRSNRSPESPATLLVGVTTGGCSRRCAPRCGWSTTGWRCRSTAAGRPGQR